MISTAALLTVPWPRVVASSSTPGRQAGLSPALPPLSRCPAFQPASSEQRLRRSAATVVCDSLRVRFGCSRLRARTAHRVSPMAAASFIWLLAICQKSREAPSATPPIGGARWHSFLLLHPVAHSGPGCKLFPIDRARAPDSGASVGPRGAPSHSYIHTGRLSGPARRASRARRASLRNDTPSCPVYMIVVVAYLVCKCS